MAEEAPFQRLVELKPMNHLEPNKPLSQLIIIMSTLQTCVKASRRHTFGRLLAPFDSMASKLWYFKGASKTLKGYLLVTIELICFQWFVARDKQVLDPSFRALTDSKGMQRIVCRN